MNVGQLPNVHSKEAQSRLLFLASWSAIGVAKRQTVDEF